MAADSANTESLVNVGFRPRVTHAAGLSLSARRRCPYVPRRMATITREKRAKSTEPKMKYAFGPETDSPNSRGGFTVNEPAWNRSNLWPKIVKEGNWNTHLSISTAKAAVARAR